MAESAATIQARTDSFPEPYDVMAQYLGDGGMAMLDDQLAKWHELNKQELQSPLREQFKKGDFNLPKGTLLHSTKYDALDTIAEQGIVSGQLIGKDEDAETHGCVDFFKVPEDMSLSEYADWCRAGTQKGTTHFPRTERSWLFGAGRISLIVDPEATGVAELLTHDGYTDEAMQGFVNKPGDRTAEDTAAILGGIPKGAIAGVMVGRQVARDETMLAHINELFPNTPVFPAPAKQA